MKKTLLGIACFCACIFSVQAQTLYGTTFNGGKDGAGTINKFIPATNDLIVAKSFESNPSTNGANPSSSLIQANDGKLYGMTYIGGSGNVGVIFSFDPSGSTYTKLMDFDYFNGGNPSGSLMQASDGKLYGMTVIGGSDNAGVIFSFDPSSSTYTNLKDFDLYNNGGYPSGSLIQASDGKLYGMTIYGSSEHGFIFSFDPSSSTYTNLKAFDYFNGGNPSGSLMQASDGKLYGMTALGGSSGDGVIFSFDPFSSTYTKLKDFDGTNGGHPRGSRLIQASDGKLYGMTYQGGSSNVGVIFSFDPSSSTYTKLKDFDITNGAYPYRSLMQASDGKLYGMTYQGGSSNYGVIFSFDPSTSTYTKLQDYNGANGANPRSAFIEVNEDIDENKPPIVSITSPANNATYVAPAAIRLVADATDPDGKIRKVQFYNGTTLIATQNSFPYALTWYPVPVGDYTFTAKAIDDKGAVTTCEVVHVTVLPNKPPVVSITSPANNANYAAPAAIRLVADAKDADGKIRKVQFYNGTTLIATQNSFPYALTWYPVPAGDYTLTAKAIDDKGAVTTSEVVQVTVATHQDAIVKSGNAKIFSTGSLTLKASPVPAKDILNIYATGFEQNKKLIISIVSVSGGVIKTIQKTSNQRMQMDVSSLRSGVYFLKVLSGDKVLYTRFVKL